MTNATDHGYAALEHCSCHNFLVEGPEILDGTASAAHDENIYLFPLVRLLYRLCNRLCCLVTLNQRGINDDANPAVPPANHVENVSNGGSGFGAYHTDSVWK